MIRASVGGAILALMLVSSASGYGYLESGLGSGVFGGSPRCAGMGEVGLLSEVSPLALTLNPALLADRQTQAFVMAYRFASLDETWSFPVHDSFDAVLGYNTYSANSKIYGDFAAGLASGRMEWCNACVAVALAPAYDYRYDFREEIRDRNSSSQPPDLLIASNFVEGTGEMRSLSAGCGVAVYEGPTFDVGFGFGVDYLFGDREVTYGITFLDKTKVPWEGGDPEYSETFATGSLTGRRYVAGASLGLGRRVKVGAAMKTECNLDGNLTLTYAGPLDSVAYFDTTFNFPPYYALGVSFKPRNELPTVIEGNVIFTGWSEVKDPLRPDVRLDDVFEWHIGVEHVFYNSRPLRFGFLFRPSPEDKEISESAVTAGTGLRVGGLDVDLAAKVAWREYRAGDLFSDDIFGAKPRQTTDLVKETTIGGTVSIGKRF